MKSSENSPKKLIIPQLADAVAGKNDFGLDLSDPNYIVYRNENIVVEIIGGITDVVLASLRVSIKVYKVGEVSPLEIYRSSQIDLFNEGQVAFSITKICERLKIESTRCKNIIYDCIEQLDSYRRNRGIASPVVIPMGTTSKKEAVSILKKDDVLSEIEQLLKQAGVCDTRLGLQLFIASISRITDKPLHTVLIAPRLLASSLVSSISKIIPKEDLREVTTISKHALSYPPTLDYWNNKTLVLHQLESIKEKDNTLLEYVLQGQSKRLITETNTKTGNYYSQRKDVTGTIQLISYTNEDYHPVFSSRQTICIPIRNTKQLQDALYEKEIKELSGIWDVNRQDYACNLLQHLARELRPLTVHNPYMDQIDLTGFFGKDIKEISKYLQLVQLITLLHQYKQDIQLTKTQKIIEVQPQYLKTALELYKELWLKKDDELYFNIRGTFTALKKLLKKKYPSDYISQTFRLKEVRKELGKSPVTLQRHLKTLEQYGKIERTGGNNRIGFEYKVLEWVDTVGKLVSYDELLNQINAL